MIRIILPAMILCGSSSCLPPSNVADTSGQPEQAANAQENITKTAPAESQSPVVAAVPNDADWQDWPLMAGQWMRSNDADAAFAAFVNPNGKSIFSIKCSKQRKSISIVRHNVHPGAAKLAITTTFGTRSMNGNSASDFEGGILGLSLSANNIVLDELIFSRGSFGLVVDDQKAIRIATSPKLARVVEDCR
ncbi:hypothetical protein ACR9YC_10395 [Parasphingorhabdus sp. DH2-15]|uniref:hypothetical protein n=1 Tax=Parasphingorhabdus sp. DH2-15 TaxID=3444112 RepID=UPI003F688EB6